MRCWPHQRAPSLIEWAGGPCSWLTTPCSRLCTRVLRWPITRSFVAGGLLLIYSLYYALTEGIGRALITDLVPASLRATAMGTYATATGAALLPASLVAGALWDSVGPGAPFACIWGGPSRASVRAAGVDPVNAGPAAQYRLNIDAVPCDNRNRDLPPLSEAQQAPINRWVLRFRHQRQPKRSASC